MAADPDDQPDARWFQTTHWSLVARAGATTSDEQRDALGQLIQRYAPALRGHLIRRRGLSPHDADDVLQSFLAAKVVERALVAAADPQRGRFRTFVLTSLDRFALTQRAHERSLKRYAGATVPADGELGLASPQPRPDQQFDIAWARGILQESLRRMREECARSGRADVWSMFEARVVSPMQDGAPAPAYEELVARFGFTSPAQASNFLVTGKRMFVRAIRGVIGEYELGDACIDAEIAELRSVFSRATG